MTTAQVETLISSIARFMVTAGPGQHLALPACAGMFKDETGRLHMQRNGHSWTLFNETSDDIAAMLVRWSR